MTGPQLADGTGRGVRVVIVDSGIDASHPSLVKACVSHFAVERVPGIGLRVVSAASGDRAGHGTAVASIIHRHAPDAELISVRVFGRNNRATAEHVFCALDWANALRVDVVNTSLGSSYVALLAKFKRRVDAAFVSGAILVSACSNLDAGLVEFPAHFPTVVSVEHALLEGLSIERVHGRLVEFRAAGVDVRAAWKNGTWAALTGSSFAAPHVAALVARLRERHPAWNAAQVKSALYDLAEPRR